MSRQYIVAVVGATGAVGEALLNLLGERQFPVEEVYALASAASSEKTVMYRNKPLLVEDLAEFDFNGVDIAFFSAGGEISKVYAPRAAEAGCIVIDNTSIFRQDQDVPLVIPEVNPQDLVDYRNRNIIANPNCSTIQMLVALKPLHDAAKISRIDVATYQAVSGAGRKGISELASQTGKLLNGQPVEPEVFDHQIAFNVIPRIDEVLETAIPVKK